MPAKQAERYSKPKLSEGHFCAYTPGTAVNAIGMIGIIQEGFIKDIIYTGINAVIFVKLLADSQTGGAVGIILLIAVGIALMIVEVISVIQIYGQRIFLGIGVAESGRCGVLCRPDGHRFPNP